MRKPRAVYDAYLGEEVPAEPIFSSNLPGIGKFTPKLYDPAALGGVVVGAEALPGGSGWRLRFDGRAEVLPGLALFPSVGTQQMARAGIDWLTLHQAEVKIALHWLDQGNPEPYFNLLTLFKEGVLC
jgi:hypothetical protein